MGRAYAAAVDLMNGSNELLEILDRMSGVRVLVVGDVMLDRYWIGRASRLSPEAPFLSFRSAAF